MGNAGEADTHIRIRADVLAETPPGQIDVSDSYGLAYDAAVQLLETRGYFEHNRSPDLPVDATANSFGNPQNIANGPRLANQLLQESANSPFESGGQLAPHAVDGVRMIIGPEGIRNPAIPKGSGKYTTQTFQTNAGDFQVRFYKNPVTGEVFYNYDYETVFRRMSGTQRQP